jgi:hypothetical protein
LSIRRITVDSFFSALKFKKNEGSATATINKLSSQRLTNEMQIDRNEARENELAQSLMTRDDDIKHH